MGNNNSRNSPDNFAILATYIVEGGRTVLKEVLMTYVRIAYLGGADPTLHNYICSEQGTILKLERKKYITKEQRELLIPSSGKQVDIDDLDLTLLCFLLTNVCNISSNERDLIDTLRKLRNEILAHARHISISDEDCEKHKQDITLCLQTLAGTISYDFKDRITSLLESMCLNRTSIQVLLDWSAKNTEMAEMTTRMGDTLGRVETIIESRFDNVETKIDTIQESMTTTPCMPPHTLKEKEVCSSCKKEYEERGSLFSGGRNCCAECTGKKKCFHCQKEFEEEGSFFSGVEFCSECSGKEWGVVYARLFKSWELADDIQDDILEEHSPSHLKGHQDARHNLLKAVKKYDKRSGQDDHTSWRYILTRKCSSVQEPKTKWGNSPLNNPRDKSLGANVERMRILQKKVTQMILSGETSEEVINLYWSELEEVIKDVEAIMGKRGYSERLTSVKTEVIDPATASNIVEEFLRKARGDQRQGCSSQALMPTPCTVQMQQQLNRIESAVCKKRIDVAC